METKERILIVDDEPSIRKYLQTLLEVDGFEVETVSSGKDALDVIGKGEKVKVTVEKPVVGVGAAGCRRVELQPLA